METGLIDGVGRRSGTSGTIVFTTDGLSAAVPASDAQTSGAGRLARRADGVDLRRGTPDSAACGRGPGLPRSRHRGRKRPPATVAASRLAGSRSTLNRHQPPKTRFSISPRSRRSWRPPHSSCARSNGALSVWTIQLRATFRPGVTKARSRHDQGSPGPLQRASGARAASSASTRVATAFEDAIVRTPRAYEPRTTSVYSDLGFMLLGFILESIATLETQFDTMRLQMGGIQDLQFNPPALWKSTDGAHAARSVARAPARRRSGR